MEYIESKKARRLTDIRYYLILVSAMLVFFLLFQPIRVQGSSMKNTLVDGDLLIMCRDWIVQGYEAGDIVVAAKDSFRNGECIIKRIIAVEGQTVDIDNETGMVYVDGQALDESYALTPTYEKGEWVFPLSVDENCYFVMGDNREESVDSRYLEIGQVQEDEIQGKIIWLLLPGMGVDGFNLKRFGTVN